MISPSYKPRVGGMETYLAAISTELTRVGNFVTVLTSQVYPDQETETVENGVHVQRVQMRGLGVDRSDAVPWEEGFFGPLAGVAELVGDSGFDVVHCHTQAGLLLGHLSGLAAARPTVASFHETVPVEDPLGLERSRFLLGACPAHRYLAGSRAFANQAIELGVPESLVEVVPMGIPRRPHVPRAQARQQLQAAFGLEPTKLLVTLIGRLTVRKEHYRLLDAYQYMRHRDGVQIVLAGSTNSTDGTYARRLERDVAAVENSDVRLFQGLDEATMDLLVDGTDIGTQPSRAEGLGLAIIELMGAGAPVVVSDIPGLREAVGSDPDALVDTTDPIAFAAALDDLVADPSLRFRRGVAAADFARGTFSIERAAAQTADVYAELIAAARP